MTLKSRGANKYMEIFKESVVQKEKFRTTSHKLLNNCFVIKKKEDTRNDYIFIVQNKEYFTEYFDLLGYDVEINEMQGVIALKSINGTGRLRLKKDESIILLILRLLYIEKKKELSLNEDVVILSDEIHDKFNMLRIELKKKLDKTRLKEIIRLFKKFNLIDPIDKDVTKHDARIKIYPSIMFAVTNDDINRYYNEINEKANKYINGGIQDEDEEIMQD
jgi:hypothetical protein